MKVGMKNFINKTVFTKDLCVIIPGQIKVNPATPSASYLSVLKTSTSSVFFFPEKLEGKTNIVIVLCELLQHFSIC